MTKIINYKRNYIFYIKFSRYDCQLNIFTLKVYCGKLLPTDEVDESLALPDFYIILTTQSGKF